MATSVDVFAKHYATLPDEEIRRLLIDIHTLVPEARDALQLESERRGISAEAAQSRTPQWTDRPRIPARLSRILQLRFLLVPDKPTEGFRSLFRNLLFFFICGAVVETVIIALQPLIAPSIDVGDFAEHLTKYTLDNTVVLAIITSKALVPKTAKTMWLIGLVEPPCLLLLFALYSFTQ